jgi:hypothetical protein
MNRAIKSQSAAGCLMLAPLLGFFLLQPLLTQCALGQMRFTYNKGQSVEPAYEGWMPNTDGTFTMYFGYMNPNWEEQLDIPVGPANAFEPGGPDQGQPTHFYPRRNPFLFTIKIPKDFGDKELTWTITSNGRTKKVYASLKSDYQIDKQVMSTEIGGDGGSLRDELRYNIPPELEIQGDTQRSVRAGEPVQLVLLAADPDNLPARRDRKPQPRHAGMPPVEGDTKEGLIAGETNIKAGETVATRSYASGEAKPPEKHPTARPAASQAPAATGSSSPTPAAAATAPAGRSGPLPGFTPPSSVVVADGPGLWATWIVYRGNASNVVFSPDPFKAWMDSRAWANSAWSPPYVIPDPPRDGKWIYTATFKEPGNYTLRAVACDGSLFTFQNLTVTVTP